MTVHELLDLYGALWNINDPLCKLATQLHSGVKTGASRSGVEQTAAADREGLCAAYFLALSDICI